MQTAFFSKCYIGIATVIKSFTAGHTPVIFYLNHIFQVVSHDVFIWSNVSTFLPRMISLIRVYLPKQGRFASFSVR